MRVQTKELGEVNLKFHHVRNDDFNFVSSISNKRKALADTYTECVISIGPKPVNEYLDKRESYIGRAYLNPSDSFNKETGRRLSLDRALADMEVSEKTKREIMVGYFSR